MNWKMLLMGNCAHPLCARRRRPELFLNLLPNLLHCHLVLLDGSLGGVKSEGGGEHKVTVHTIVGNHTLDSKRPLH